jgi:HK97 gp10 family phage protein
VGRPAYIKFYDTHEEVIKELRNMTKAALRKGGKVVMKKLKAGTPKRSGKASKLIGQRTRIFKGQPHLEIGYYSRTYARKKKGINLPTNYVALLEDGTKPHTITAGVKSSRGKVRAVTGRKVLSDGSRFYGRVVSHRGAKPYHILRDTVKNGIGEITIVLKEQLKELNKKLDEIRGYSGEEEIDDA